MKDEIFQKFLPSFSKVFTPLIFSIFSKRSYTMTFSLPSILSIVFILGINPIIIYRMKMEYFVKYHLGIFTSFECHMRKKWIHDKIKIFKIS
eukprot:UN10849